MAAAVTLAVGRHAAQAASLPRSTLTSPVAGGAAGGAADALARARAAEAALARLKASARAEILRLRQIAETQQKQMGAMRAQLVAARTGAEGADGAPPASPEVLRGVGGSATSPAELAEALGIAKLQLMVRVVRSRVVCHVSLMN